MGKSKRLFEYIQQKEINSKQLSKNETKAIALRIMKSKIFEKD